jgi:hypothetical protein
MKNLSFQQIILLLVFILVPLINFVMQRLRRRAEDQIPIRRQAKAISTPTIPPAPRPSRDRVQVPQPPTVSTPLSERRFIKRSLLGAQRDVRRGIIMMTVLGPCRAFDPPGAGLAR